MDKGELTGRIKDIAQDLGFTAVGIAPASALPGDRLDVWLARSYHGEMAYMERTSGKRRDPQRVLPEVRSIVSVALNYYHSYSLSYEQPDRGVISRYASGRDYHKVMERKLKKMWQSIQEVAPEAHGRYYVDTGPVMDKHWASQSGIGWLGKHTNVLSREAGSWFFLGEILLDFELEYDAPSADFCGSCTRCIEACPTGAIVEPYVLDGRRCISYLTIETRGNIPVEFREPMKNLVFGCDICQDVCPWNRTVPLSTVEDFDGRTENRAPELRELASLSPEEFKQRFQGSAVQRAKWQGFMRNVAVAMGNSHNPEMIPELKQLAACGDPVVEEHANWALQILEGQRHEEH